MALFVVSIVAAVGAVVVASPDGLTLGPPWLVALLAVGVSVAEFRSLHVEYLDQSVANAPTAGIFTIALVTLPPAGVLVTIALGGIALRARGPVVKRVVNWGLLLLGAAVMISVFHALGAPPVDRPGGWWTVGVAIVAGGVVDLAVLRHVVRIATGRGDRLPMHTGALMLGWSLLWAAVGLCVLLVVPVSPAAALLVIVPAAAAEQLTQVAVHQRKEIRRLRTLYDLSAGVTQSSGAEAQLTAVLDDARDIVRCTEVELVLLASGPDSQDLVVRAGVEGLRTGATPRPDPSGLEQVTMRWPDEAAERVSVFTDDAVAVPVTVDDELLGSIRAWGRPSGRSPFGEADRTALHALATQVGAVVGRRRLAAQLRAAADEQAYLEAHDPLTGLGNRRWFATAIGELADQQGVTVVLLNLRGFRRVNEALGQMAGDRLLVEVAERLRGVVPAVGAIARLGGDEFGFAVPGEEPVDVAAITGDDMQMRLRGRDARLDLAVGWAHMDRGEGPAVALRRADLALTVARAARAGAVVGYEPALEETVARRSALATALPAALRDGAMDIHLQPQLDLATGTVVGAEALVRWTHPDLGRVSPDEFVPLVEDLGLAPVLARHVLGLAVHEAAGWLRSGAPMEVSVNVSAHDLDGDDLAADVAAVLEQTGLPPSLLTLELTETAMMTDRARSMASIAALAGLGVRLSIDDFGTGHSSLAYLAELPVGEVKIDRAFTQQLAPGADGDVIVRTVTELAARRGFLVVAEGVEDAETLGRLRELGVHRAQGWHIGRPVPRADFADAPHAVA